ncbi:SusC/RagA family TonB-linked outer membrane protein [Pedobacter petrophilus]|uniref:SusC/RagA family TonB-linked outer membrane protein n=1 Tax=Pedobacter petrophilus TaxID=1908241 RepID=A0A7K0G2H0_9SPHI|nr:SusC/RagA family TonB-linked outer membrane protein [Pedobacter petrophilus]MRX78018.1 SusC/RagA family TonB-linked outer membrane protein [Pedobacter petrophilus]
MKLKYCSSVFLISILLLNISKNANAQDSKDTVEVINIKEKGKNLKNIGYGKQPFNHITSSISTVNGEDIQQNFNLNLGNTLYGRLPGLTVIQGNSEPGVGNPGFIVRGKNTFGGASLSPLIIVDGFIAGGNDFGSIFSQLIPEEVESITLLKDAASTAVYGNRGANGVILVTTNRGSSGPLKINFSTRQGFSQAFSLPEFLNSGDYATLFNEARQNDGLTPLYTPQAINSYRSGDSPFAFPHVNWYDEVLRKTAPVSSYNLGFKGGDKTVKYFVMLNALGSQGLFKNFGDLDPESTNSTYHRYNFRSNIDINLSDNLAVAFNLAGSVENKANPWEYNTTSTFSLLERIPSNAFPVRNLDGSFGGNNLYASNPVANLLANGFDQSNGRTLQTSLRLTQKLDKLINGLSATGVVSINNYFIAGSEKNKTYTLFPVLPGAFDTNGNPILGQGIGLTTSLSGVETTRTQYRNFELQGALNYNRVINKHDFSAFLLFNTDNEVRNFSSGAESDPYKHNGVATRLTYVYSDKYIAEFSAGYMGTENYAAGKRYGFFPSGSLGWVVSQENFLNKSKVINFLKLRASYGIAGNENTGGSRYAFITNYNTFTGAEAALGNPNITWEEEKSLNIGADATLLNNLQFSVDVFKRDRSNILTQPLDVYPQFFGATLPDLNIGKTANQGLELALRYNSKSTGKLNYFIEANFSHYKNEIVYNAQLPQLNAGLIAKGGSIDQPRRLMAIGFFTAQEIAERATNPAKYPIPVGVTARPGDLKYQDIGGLNGVPDGIIDNNDLVSNGYPTGQPRTTLGLNAGFKFKGFDLNFVVQAVTGNSVNLNTGIFQAFQNNGNIGSIAVGRWTPETASTATYPRLSSVNDLNNFQNSSFWIKDGSFIKLRSAEFGYSFPKELLNKFKIGQARLFVNGNNLLSFDHIEYGDPESLAGYPVLRTFVLGTRIQF